MSTFAQRRAFIDADGKQKELSGVRGREQCRAAHLVGACLLFELLQRLSRTDRTSNCCIDRAIDKHFDEFLLRLRRPYDVSSRLSNVAHEHNIRKAPHLRHRAQQVWVTLSHPYADSALRSRSESRKLA
jgi:hypothetical protein